MGIENKSEALTRAILDEMAKLRPDEQENIAELKAYMEQYGVEEYLQEAKIDFNPATIKKFAELLIMVNNTEAKRKQLGIPNMSETMEAYREHMQDSSGKWLESYEDIINADYLHRLAAGQGSRIYSAPTESKLYSNIEHELLKVVHHYYYASFCDAMKDKRELKEVEANATPKQKRAIAEWKKRHNKSTSDIKDMLTRAKRGKYYVVGVNGNYDYVITKYEQDKKSGAAKEYEILLPLEDINKTTEELIAEWKIPAEWKITNEFELLGISLLNALLNNESIDYEQLEEKNMAVMTTTAAIGSIVSAGSNYNPPIRYIETLSTKSDIVREQRIDVKEIQRLLKNEYTAVYTANRELIILFPNVSDEAKKIGVQLLFQITSFTAETGTSKVPFDLNRYMQERGLTNKQSAGQTFGSIINYLGSIRFAKHIGEHKYKLVAAFQIVLDAKNKTTDAIELAPEFAEEIIKNSNTYYVTGKSAFNIDARYYPYANSFHYTIFDHIQMNTGKTNERIISVLTLINRAPDFPDLNKAEKNRKTRRVMQSFDKNMDVLKESGTLWQYENGAKNSEAMSYAEWKEAKVHISFTQELEEINKPIREARMQYKEKQRQANNEDTILEQAKAIKRKRRKQSKGRKQ